MISMEDLEGVIENTCTIIAQENNIPICKRYGCKTESIKLRHRDRYTLDQKESYYKYYITEKPAPQSVLEDNVVLVYRNCVLATRLLQTSVGSNYEFEMGPNKIQGHITKNIGHIHNEVDLEAKIVNIEGEDSRSYDSITSFWNLLKSSKLKREKNISLQKELEEKRRKADEDCLSAQEKKRITDEIKKIKNENRILEGQIQKQLNLSKYIHNQTQLRFRPVIDKVQSSIKFNNLYNGINVVISGGPGTGKTTTMIARLKYLTDLKAIEEDLSVGNNIYQLSQNQLNTLINLIKEDKDWVFFSPSQLLKEYLAKAMEGEGLSRPSSKTKYWEDYILLMMREYGFFALDSKGKSLFRRYRKKQDLELIYQNSKVIEKFTQYYINSLYNTIQRLPDITKTNYRWKNLAAYIVERLSSILNSTVGQIIDRLTILHTNRYSECIQFENELKQYIDNAKERIYYIYGQITQNSDDYNTLKSLLNTNKEELIETEDEETEEETDSVETTGDEFAFEDYTLSEGQSIQKLLESLLKPLSRNMIDSTKKLTERQSKINIVLQKYLTEDDKNLLLNVGEYYILREYTKYVKGPVKVMLQGIPSLYKRFRKKILDEKDSGWNLIALKEIIDNGNRELHIQEQSLLIGFINNIIRSLQIKNQHKPINGKYATCYNVYARPIIGIDEATDFSEIEIYAMKSFAYTEFSSITLSGDIMQRMTVRGIHSWDDLNNIIPNKRIEQLQVSYRQSKKMLDVALQLYQDTLGEKAIYKSYLKEDNVPEAIAITHIDEDTKIKWIENRIIEVYKVYGNHLPSIAIFLNDKNEAASFAEKLGESDFFFDNGIAVVDCSKGQTIGNHEQVRVFPIDLVKGMEFDVVFFHNIDDTNFSNDLIKRYLYVGVSRASFFLGATFKNNCPELNKYFKFGQNWNSIQ